MVASAFSDYPELAEELRQALNAFAHPDEFLALLGQGDDALLKATRVVLGRSDVEPFMETFVRVAREAAVHADRANALGRMRFVRHPAVAACMRDALRDPSGVVRAVAASVVVSKLGPEDAEALVEALDDPSFEVRREAALGLKKLAEPSLVTRLAANLRQLAAEPEAEPARASARTALLEALGQAIGCCADPGDLEEVDTLAQDADPVVRAAAIRALGQRPHEVAALRLLIRCAGDSQASVRRAALAEVDLRWPRWSEIDPVERQARAACLSAGLADVNPEIRNFCAEALRRHGVHGSLAALMEAIERLGTSAVANDLAERACRRQLLEAVGSLSADAPARELTPAVITKIAWLRTHADPHVAAWAAEVQRDLHGMVVAELFGQVFAEPALRARAEALGLVGARDDHSANALLGGLEDSDRRIRFLAAWLLFHHARCGHATWIEAGLLDDRPRVRRLAATFAARLGRRDLLPRLTKILAHTDPQTRGAAAKAIASLGRAHRTDEDEGACAGWLSFTAPPVWQD